ncbi:putative exported protein [Pectobacterium atrosepticum SCRI1043]|uniref:Exported protein n=1 Tax=Pectobacterium atrosepticum (strain SCRI 1043 / ATCC BAA-672) TaxID=218491 RepID=Q6CZ30_PECAS|nr:hypothetical protein [Pectobacterium atrosepticum]GKV87593.1 hypothetical protein PEC301296_39040 [Pectobacterium carotovorum subsp. carotovorum]AIA73084.1 hypothetical protein EV46_21525 [Pectobacterium atrosepticum]AIK16107.1 putative exported protein [Pectobacterium atrosepticum]ATY92746.1 hypothetical protein CVS35_21570 [Pectobacterium atrosepticum]KFX13232.1 hypothetical protein JV34_15535 [Pectobacterium atrosepticum]
MKKKIIILLAVLLLIALPLIYYWPAIVILTEGSSRYSEQDTRRYEMLTDEIIKNCPRISSVYDFGYATVDGPALEVSNITFQNTNDATNIRAYLKSLGFTLSYTDTTGEYWKSTDSDKTIHIGIIRDPKTVVVDVIRK